MFLDNSACNLASLNLMKFLREDGTFDVERYKTAAEISLPHKKSWSITRAIRRMTSR